MKKIFVLFSFLLSSNQVFAWGAKGHEIVASVGADSTAGFGQEFWQANSDGLRQLSTVPDRLWKRSETKTEEAPNHWFQVDAYVPSLNSSEILAFPRAYSDAVEKYGSEAITKNGTAPWRIQQFYKLAIEALKSNDSKMAIEYVGVMTHYIGDLSQPLHVSENYDGVETGDKGIHAFFETTNILDQDAIQTEVSARAALLLKDPHFLAQFQGSLSDVLFNEISRSIAGRDSIINADLQLGRDSDDGKATLLTIAEDHMADGAATLSLVLQRLWKESGASLNASPAAIEDPDWIATDFTGDGKAAICLPPSPAIDDCSAR